MEKKSVDLPKPVDSWDLDFKIFESKDGIRYL